MRGLCVQVGGDSHSSFHGFAEPTEVHGHSLELTVWIISSYGEMGGEIKQGRRRTNKYVSVPDVPGTNLNPIPSFVGWSSAPPLCRTTFPLPSAGASPVWRWPGSWWSATSTRRGWWSFRRLSGGQRWSGEPGCWVTFLFRTEPVHVLPCGQCNPYWHRVEKYWKFSRL